MGVGEDDNEDGDGNINGNADGDINVDGADGGDGSDDDGQEFTFIHPPL